MVGSTCSEVCCLLVVSGGVDVGQHGLLPPVLLRLAPGCLPTTPFPPHPIHPLIHPIPPIHPPYTQLLAARPHAPEPGRKTTAEGAAHAVHFVADAHGLLLYAVVTAPAYPPRCIFVVCVCVCVCVCVLGGLDGGGGIL